MSHEKAGKNEQRGGDQPSGELVAHKCPFSWKLELSVEVQGRRQSVPGAITKEAATFRRIIHDYLGVRRPGARFGIRSLESSDNKPATGRGRFV